MCHKSFLIQMNKQNSELLKVLAGLRLIHSVRKNSEQQLHVHWPGAVLRMKLDTKNTQKLKSEKHLKLQQIAKIGNFTFC